MKSVFDKLVREISREERQLMLDKINKTIGLDNEPMWHEENSYSEIPVQAETFRHLSLFSKIKIVLLELLTGQRRETLIKALATSRIRKRLAKKISHLIDLDKGMLYPEFHGLLVILQSAAKMFTPILSQIISLQKPDFYVYLFKIEDENLYNKLDEELDPERLIRSNPDIIETEIKKQLNQRFDNLTGDISHECRVRMMAHAFVLSRLHELSVFPYERLIRLFEGEEDDTVSPASLTQAKILLMELGDAFYSFQKPPAPILLEAIFLFSIESSLESGTENFDMDANLSVFMKSAGDSLGLIRDVNRKIPWLDLLKALSGDSRYVPYSAGGEDWFQCFKMFWKKRLETKHHKWLQKKKQSECLSEIKNLWGVHSILLLAGYRNEDYQDDVQFQHVHSMAVIKTMFLEIFPGKLYHVLSRIVNRGKFYKNRNKREFDETFLHFILAQEKIREMEKNFRGDGEYRAKLNSIFRGSGTKKEHAQMIKNWAHDIDRKIRGMVHSCTEDIELMAKLLRGIIMGNGEDYDTLSNLKEISDSTRAAFQKELENVYKIISGTSNFLRELLVLEGDSIG